MADITPSKKNIDENLAKFGSALSEAFYFLLGGSINWLNQNAADQVGDVMQSTLTEAQFQAKRNATWVLMDGSDVTGSDWSTLTGNSNIPDMRGEFARGADNGRGVDSGRTLLSTQGDSVKSHGHSILTDYAAGPSAPTTEKVVGTPGPITAPIDGTSPVYNNTNGAPSGPHQYIQNTGSEGRPRNVALNFFIKIND